MSVDAGIPPTTTVLAAVTVGPGRGSPLAAAARALLTRTVVETNLHLPGMFELTFQTAEGRTLRGAGLHIGATVRISEGTVGAAAQPLIVGEVTALEGAYSGLSSTTVVRGYDLCHRLQRARRTRAFVNMSDADIAAQIAKDAGLKLGEIAPTGVVHDHLAQCDQTDWDFLRQRAREIGFEFGIVDGLFTLRPQASVDDAGPAHVLKLGGNLRSLATRLTAGNLSPEVEVRVWDPVRATVVASKTRTGTGSVSANSRPAAAETAALFSKSVDRSVPAKPVAPAVGEHGPAPGDTAFVVYDRPVATGAAADGAATAVARAVSEHLGSTFAQAEGDAEGSPRIQAGRVVRIEHAPDPFPDAWVVTGARHVFDFAGGGYRTRFTASGSHDRSLLGLASVGATQPSAPRIPGVVCAVVTNINDKVGRVKVMLPWLSPDYESSWAPVVQFGAGKRSGALFLPEVGDEVLVGFEFGDPRRPYVLGGIVNDASAYSLVGSAIQATGAAAQVVRRGFVSAAGNQLVFSDEVPPGDEAKPVRSQIALGTGDGKLGLALDAVAGTVVLGCSPEDPPGQLTVQCGAGGTVNIRAGSGATMNIDGGDSLTIKSQASMTIESSGELSIKGDTISLN